MKKQQTYGSYNVSFKPVTGRNASTGMTYPLAVPAPILLSFGNTGFIDTVNGKDGSFRPVVHSKRSWRLKGDRGETLLNCYIPATGPVVVSWEGAAQHATRAGLSVLNTTMAPNPPTSMNIDWAALEAQAVSAMMPSLNEGESLLRYLVELKDFKRLGASIVARARAASNPLLSKRTNANSLWAEAFGISKKKSKTATGKLREVSKAYLAYMFAWKPLIEEAYQLVQAGLSWKTRVSEYMRRANTPQQRYWGTNVASPSFSTNRVIAQSTYTGPTGFFGVIGTPKTSWAVKEVSATPIRFSATMRYRYTFPDELVKAANGLSGLLDVIGGRLSLADVWELIPFSFLVDWVVNVGQYLERLRVDNIDLRGRTEILDFCSSAKGKRKYELTVTPWHHVGGSWNTSRSISVVVADGEETYYIRRRSIPNMYGALTLSGLSGTEMLLGGALVSSRYGK